MVIGRKMRIYLDVSVGAITIAIASGSIILTYPPEKKRNKMSEECKICYSYVGGGEGKEGYTR